MIPRVLEPEVVDTSDEVEAYAAMDFSVANEAVVQRLLELGADGVMLDLGTGPGQIPLLVCERFDNARILGIDLSRDMLARAELRRQDSPHSERIEYRLGNAKSLFFDDGVFDVVYSNALIHHLADPRPLLSEARRVLRPGGVLLVRDLFRPPSEARAREIVGQHGKGTTPKQKARFHAALCAALTPEELRECADHAGLTDAEIVVDSDRHMSLQISRRR